MTLKMQKKNLEKSNRLICLGTAGLNDINYGFSNSKNQYPKIELLNYAINCGVNAIDSSPRYGESENIVGKYLYKKNKELFISSKIDNLEIKNQNIVDIMFKSVQSSIKKLNLKKLNLCYLHQNDIQIISDKNIQKGLKLLKDYELVDTVGTSVYELQELEYTVDSFFYDWVQIPVNITDTYFYNYLIKKKSNIKIAARSILLQGILFQRENVIKKNVASSNNLYKYISSLKSDLSIDEKIFKQLTISYLNYLPKLSKIIIGSVSPVHLKFFMDSLNKSIDKNTLDIINERAYSQKEWTNPRNW